MKKKKIRRGSGANLEKVPYVYDQASGNGLDINPVVLMEDLEAADLVLQKNSKAGRIGVLARAHGEVRLWTWRIVVADHRVSFRVAHGSQMVWFESKGLRH